MSIDTSDMRPPHLPPSIPRGKAETIIGPDGLALTREGLPAVDTDRWVPSRKAIVVAAVEGRLLSVDEACSRYSLTIEEFSGWMRAVERSGFAGLRVTRAKEYRVRYQRSQRYS